MGLKYKVLARCYTFNHSQYIEDTLEGFASQQTNFPFLALIIDDASTDNEQVVISSWISSNCMHDSIKETETQDAFILEAVHQNNGNCFFVVYFLKENHWRKKSKNIYCKCWRDMSQYEAVCEGDDYWTDSHKLQKQVDFMDAHPDYSMCFHSASILNEINKINTRIQCTEIENRDYTGTEILDKWTIPTASILYRMDIRKVKVEGSNRVVFSDIVMFLKACKVGKLRGMNEVMSVYRIHGNSLTNGKQYTKMQIFRLPDHYKCIKENFDFVDSKAVNKRLVFSLLRRVKYQEGLKLKFADFKDAVLTSPYFTIYYIVKLILFYYVDRQKAIS